MMMLAPSASSSMNATVLGDADMTVMRVYFVKPQAAIAMTFSDDPRMERSPTISRDRPPRSLRRNPS